MSDFPEWFEGAELNYAENLLKFRDDQVALITTSEDGATEKVTYSQLYEETKLYAAAFRKCGVRKGDMIMCYMSNRKEAVVGMLAAVSIGAILTGALPQLGYEAVISRVSQVNPKILLTLDRFSFNYQEIDMFSNVEEIAKSLLSLEKVIIVPSKKEMKKEQVSKIRNGCSLDEFLALGRKKDGTVPELIFEQVSFSYPVFINYTSGTTGKPKAIIHGAGVGWASWCVFTTYLFQGLTVVLHEGNPFLLTPTSFWDMVDELKISVLYITPTLLDELQKRRYVPSKTVIGEVGDLVLSIPNPAMTVGLMGDDHHSLFREKFYSKYPGKFLIGDSGMFNLYTRRLIVCGRCDDTIKQRGCRFGCSEIYNVVDHFTEVHDSLVASQFNKELDERAVLFLIMREGRTFNDDLVQRIRNRISDDLTPRHVPDVIIETKEIPFNTNGKKLEILVKKIINNLPCNTDALSNPDCLKYYRNRPELQDF